MGIAALNPSYKIWRCKQRGIFPEEIKHINSLSRRREGVRVRGFRLQQHWFHHIALMRRINQHQRR